MRTRTPSLQKEDTRFSITRPISPINETFLTSTRPYTPYPLYQQKVRTLLKPPDYSRQAPNFMSARETRSDFEKKEASLQVKLLKRTLNLMTEDFNSTTRKKNILVSESHKVSELEHVGKHDLEYLHSYYKGLEKDEEEMLTKIRSEFNNNLVYRHVRERMRQTLMHLELKNQYLQSQIRTKDFLIDSEHRKKIQTLEKKFTMAQAFRQTHKIVSLDLKDRTQDLNILEDDIGAREKIHELRKKRIKKYEEIAEEAAIEEGDLKSNDIREKRILHVFWTRYLMAREERIKKKSAGVVEAFENVKIVTKILEPSEVVEKFLRKEEKFVELMNSLSDIRGKCVGYEDMNQGLEEKIAHFSLTQSGDIGQDSKELRRIVLEKMSLVNEAVEKKDKVEVMKQKVIKWLNVNLEILGVKLRDKGLKESFEVLGKVVKNIIKQNSAKSL